MDVENEIRFCYFRRGENIEEQTMLKEGIQVKNTLENLILSLFGKMELPWHGKRKIYST